MKIREDKSAKSCANGVVLQQAINVDAAFCQNQSAGRASS